MYSTTNTDRICFWINFVKLYKSKHRVDQISFLIYIMVKVQISAKRLKCVKNKGTHSIGIQTGFAFE